MTRNQLWVPRLAGLWLAVVCSANALAQDADDGWQLRFTIYGWLPDVSGTTVFPTGEEGAIKIDVSDVLDKLDATLMGAFDARRGRWGMFTDLTYLDLSDNTSGLREFSVGDAQIPGDVTMTAGIDVTSWVVTAAGLYNLRTTERGVTDFVFGARMVDVEQTLEWSFDGNIGPLPIPGRSGVGEVSETLVDAIIGIKGYSYVGESGRWFIPYYLDIGGGDADVTWQAMLGFGYSFGWGDTVLTWRILDYDLDNDTGIVDMEFSGPMIGASFTW